VHLKAADVAVKRRMLSDAARHSVAAEYGLRSSFGEPPRGVLLEVLVQRLWITYYTGDTARAYEECLSLANEVDETGDPRLQMMLHSCASMSCLTAGRFVGSPDAVEHARMSYKAWQRTGEPAGSAQSEGLLGTALLWAGDLVTAERHLLSALRHSESSGDLASQLSLLGNLGLLARRSGDTGRTRSYAERILDAADEREFPDHVGGARGLLAWVALREGHQRLAETRAREAMRGMEVVPQFPFWWTALAPVMVVETGRGDVMDAVVRARSMLAPGQQMLELAFVDAIQAAVSAWDAGDETSAREELDSAVKAGRVFNYT
jgi:hypothetical protein